MDITLLLTAIGLILTIAFPLFGFYRKRMELYNYYSIIWKKARKVTVKEIMGVRPFDEYYMKREVDSILLERLTQRQNTLIVGQPLSGKTRAVFNALKHIDIKLFLLMPRSIPMPVFSLPKDYGFRKAKVIFIDDLQHYIEKQENYHLLFKEAQHKNIPIIAACHSGREFSKVKNKLIEQNLSVDMVFGEGVVELAKLTPDTGKEVAQKLGMQWDSVRFNGTIGSIFMRLSQMETRFDTCDNIERTILRVMRNLYLSGIYEDNNIIRSSWIKKASLKHELEAKEFEWSGWFKSLEEKEFIRVAGTGKIWAEDAYLEHVVKPEADSTMLELFNESIEMFFDDHEVLQMTGERIYDHAVDDADVSDYLNLAIKAFVRVLDLLKESKENALLIKVKNSLGQAYLSLSYLQDTVGNSRIAIKYFNEMLELVGEEENPYEYARTKMKIGNAFRVFALIENNEESCQKSIKAYNEALEIFSIEKNPNDLALTYNNLGSSFQLLGETTDHVANYKRSLEAFEKARKVRDKTGYPKDRGFTLYNSANTYTYLSFYEETEKNLVKAIELYKEYQQCGTANNSAGRFAGLMNSIGYAYFQLALVKDLKSNIKLAIEYLNKALEVRTISQMPVERAETLCNLGDVYLLLSENEVEYRLKNLNESRKFLEEALQVEGIRNLYKIFTSVKSILGNVYIKLSESGENTKDNFERGMKLLVEASDSARNLLSKEYELIMKSIETAKKNSRSEVE